MNYQYQPLPKENSALRQNKTKWHGKHNFIFHLYTPFELLDNGKIIVTTVIQNYNTETYIHILTNSTNATLYNNVEVFQFFLLIQKIHDTIKKLVSFNKQYICNFRYMKIFSN